MSLDTPPDPAGRPHLDEEAVSAALDDEATADELAHLRACARCRAAVDRLRAASDAVAAPVAIDAEAREAAIGAAIAAFQPVSQRPSRATSGPVTQLPHRDRGSWRRRAAAPWLGIAAALLLVVLALPLLRGSDEEGLETSASDGATSERAEAGGGSSGDDAAGGTDAEAGAPVDVGDVGALERGADLRPVIDAALGPAGEEEAVDEARPEGGQGEASADAEDDVGSGPADGSEEGSVATTTAGTPAPIAEAPVTAEEGSQPGEGDCEAAVRAALPEAGPLLLVGSATVDGGAALVYGFAGSGDRETVLAALVRRDGCELVTFQSYARG
jgi:hypothetical protein